MNGCLISKNVYLGPEPPHSRHQKLPHHARCTFGTSYQCRPRAVATRTCPRSWLHLVVTFLEAARCPSGHPTRTALELHVCHAWRAPRFQPHSAVGVHGVDISRGLGAMRPRTRDQVATNDRAKQGAILLAVPSPACAAISKSANLLARTFPFMFTSSVTCTSSEYPHEPFRFPRPPDRHPRELARTPATNARNGFVLHRGHQSVVRDVVD